MRLADLFHEHSSLSRWNENEAAEAIADFVGDRTDKDDLEVWYPRHPRIPLLPLQWQALSRKNLAETILGRRSRRSFSPRKITFQEISDLLGLAYGIASNGAPGSPFPGLSTVPSAGGLFPLHVYLLSQGTELLDGLFHYHFRFPLLRQIRLKKSDEAWNLPFIHTSNLENVPPLFLVITARLQKPCSKYGERGYRFGLLEAGHLGQNLMLVGEALRLGTVALGGFHDRDLANFLGLDFLEEKPLSVIGIGTV